MSNTSVWIHGLFDTKDTQPIIVPSYRPNLQHHIFNHLLELNCTPKIVNGTADHLHVLFKLNPQKTLSEIFKNIKGNSSHWVNQNDLSPERFAWSVGYDAYAVNYKNLKNIIEYIENQEEIHKNLSFEQERKKFLAYHDLLFEDQKKF